MFLRGGVSRARRRRGASVSHAPRRSYGRPIGRRRQRNAEAGMEMIGIDVGGTGIKAAVVETTSGELMTERVRVETPHPATPKAVVKATAGLVAELPRDAARRHRLSGGDPRRRRQDGRQHRPLVDRHAGRHALRRRARPPARDRQRRRRRRASPRCASAPGAGRRGTVLMLTLGTGIGSALFRDGVLAAEHRARAPAGARQGRRAARRRVDQGVSKGLSWHAWSKRAGRVRRRSSTRSSGPIS